eukprot:m.1276046 g.1276046  ORF g.1276046 m.1276046 type:complete len:567 (-) comp24762_c0_seq25:4762-6462(-)
MWFVEEIFSDTPAITAAATVLCAVIGIILSAVYQFSGLDRGQKQLPKGSCLSPPVAPMSLPLVGHAVWYKNDPVGYLVELAQSKSRESPIHGVVRVNLAGFHTTIVSSEVAMKAIATAPSSVLSLRDAVADFGFEEALGDLNVYLGTDVHRHVLKGHVYPTLKHNVAIQMDAIRRAVDDHFFSNSTNDSKNVLPTMRKVFLQSSIELFVGLRLIRKHPEFIDQYMEFQDQLEEAIAKAIVLPKWVAQNLVLPRIRQQRQLLVQMLTGCIEEMWESTSGTASNDDDDTELVGYWTLALRTMRWQDLRGWTAFCRRQEHASATTWVPGITVSAPHAAEFIIGLLFASHKNPSLGASQTLLFLLDDQHSNIRKAVVDEARERNTASLRCLSGQAVLDSLPRLHRCVLEALRLTAHTIGGVRKVVAQEGFSFPAQTDGVQYHLRQGEYVAISHSTPHMDPSRWARPTQFDPFGREWESPDADEYRLTTFSHGVHRCPGRHLAQVQMALTLSYLLSCGQITAVEQPLPRLCYARATLAQRSAPCHVTVQRLDPDCCQEARTEPPQERAHVS